MEKPFEVNLRRTVLHCGKRVNNFFVVVLFFERLAGELLERKIAVRWDRCGGRGRVRAEVLEHAVVDRCLRSRAACTVKSCWGDVACCLTWRPTRPEFCELQGRRSLVRWLRAGCASGDREG
ncbi:unnamed protein product [Ostreobium quekettii]|uniref:Uncharacterized protein n=1 Tax=Ostreobium quekettii TaxID=121088 RepID=A0A8S1JAC8_9CHLO|nr:unnamed protein product [Ostreobium quekettii]